MQLSDTGTTRSLILEQSRKALCAPQMGCDCADWARSRGNGFFLYPACRLTRLEELGDLLLRVIQKNRRQCNTGPGPHDLASAFKMLVLRTLYNLHESQSSLGKFRAAEVQKMIVGMARG